MPIAAIICALALLLWWVTAHDDGVGTYLFFTVLVLVVLAVMIFLIFGAAVIHKLVWG